MAEMVHVMFLLLGVVVGGGEGKLIDLSAYENLILKEHNDLRRTVTPQASDMRQIVWDEDLAKSAEDWAEYCRYERPPGYMYNSGANLAYQRYHVNSKRASSVRANVLQGLRSWSREREYFQYGPDCGQTCSYVQMIYASSYRVGCAMSTCSRLRVGDQMESYSTLFLCFYTPQGKLMMSYPYRKGDTCSECPVDTYCYEGLCVEGSPLMEAAALSASKTVVASLYGPAALALPADSEVSEVAVSRAFRRPRDMSTDQLTDGEINFLVQVHNMFREEEGEARLRWDAGLKRWSDWVISCEADYPGPPHTFTNFHRSSHDMPMYEVVYEWRKEGKDTNIQMQKGCRTPYDHTDCNHYTNLMQPTVRTFACSARDCQDNTRQLVCLYDSPNGFRQP